MYNMLSRIPSVVFFSHRKSAGDSIPKNEGELMELQESDPRVNKIAKDV